MHGGGMGRVDELIHDGARRSGELMNKVAGRADELIHCGGVRRVDELARRLRRKSGRADTCRRGAQVDAQTRGNGGAHVASGRLAHTSQTKTPTGQRRRSICKQSCCGASLPLLPPTCGLCSCSCVNAIASPPLQHVPHNRSAAWSLRCGVLQH